MTKMGKTTTFVYDTNEEMEKQAPGYRKVVLVSRIADLGLEVALIAGAIGLLLLHRWGWWLSLAWVVMEIGYLVLTLLYLWFVAMPAANRMVHAVPHDDNHICGGMVNGNTFYHIGWALFSFVFLAYPLLVLLLLVLPPVWRAFSARTSRAQQLEEEEAPRRRRSVERARLQ
jgi:hypothetical protein